MEKITKKLPRLQQNCAILCIFVLSVALFFSLAQIFLIHNPRKIDFPNTGNADTTKFCTDLIAAYPKTNALGSIGYVLYSRNQYPDSWAILKNNGDYIYPAAYVLQKYALGVSEVTVPVPYTNPPDNYMLSAQNQSATTSANINDILTFSLDGAKANKYAVSISPTAASIIQDFQYNPQYNKFFAILQIKNVGLFQVGVNQILAPVRMYTTDIVGN
ncbi:MAG TPA: hypothetical protein VLG12_04490 [Candidatus Saccharimonadales bacterium]|nr:hypothetical protein [Candidatus Saccharimonadales bacterium]